MYAATSDYPVDFIARFPVFFAKLGQGRKGGVMVNADEKSEIADEFGRSNGHQYQAMGRCFTERDRQTAIFLVSVSCGTEVGAMVITDWLADAAKAEARRQVEIELAAQIEDASRQMKAAETAFTEARMREVQAYEARKEALALLSEAREVRNAAGADARAGAEIVSLRAQLQDCQRRLNAITEALA